MLWMILEKRSLQWGKLLIIFIYCCSLLDNPYCLKLHAITLEPLSLVTEYMKHGDLLSLIREEKKEILWDLRLKIAYDIAQGMFYMHNANPTLLHLDLKSPNILLCSLNHFDEVCAKVI